MRARVAGQYFAQRCGEGRGGGHFRVHGSVSLRHLRWSWAITSSGGPGLGRFGGLVALLPAVRGWLAGHA